MEKFQIEKKLGDSGYINKNCWLAKNLGYPPSKHCQYCELKFSKCLFFKYLIVSIVLISIIFSVALIIEGTISKIIIVSVFGLVLTYGYFFDKSTQKIIESSFAQRKSKESFEELSRNLQHTVDDQTREIKHAYNVEKKAREGLQELDKQKNEFMMVTQHHLRTPLTSMMGYVCLLQEGAYGKVPKKISDIINKVGISSGKLIKIVNEFLDLSRLEMDGKVIKLEPDIDVKAIIEGIISEMSIGADKKGLFLTIEEPIGDVPKIQADSNKLQIVFVNIIDNAIKYTQTGGIVIKFNNKTEGARRILDVVIKDTGIGMDKSQIDSLFATLFARGEDAKSVNVTGLGVGMYLSQKIINAHNGKIWAESDGLNKGTVFHIELPVN